MDFNEVEKLVRNFVGKDQLTEAIEVLNDFFQDDKDLDAIALQSAKYHAIVNLRLEGTVDEQEADRVLNKLRLAILQLLRSKKEYFKYKEQTFGKEVKPPREEVQDKVLIPVFFSVASPHNDQQQAYIQELTTYFQEHGIELRTLKEWNDNDPLLPIIDAMRNSNGCLVLALERFFIHQGFLKKGSVQEDQIDDQAMASPWLHIEAAVARSLNLPLIILKDENLLNEGLIHNDKQEWGIVRTNYQNIEEIKQYPIKNFILSWINQVKQFYQKT